MRFAKAVVAAAAAALMCGGLPAHAAPARTSGTDAVQVLRDAISAPDKHSYVGLVQNVEYGSARTNATMYRIEHRAPELTRRWYVAPQSLYGDEIVSRGDTTYNVDMKNKKIIVSKDDAIDDQVAMDDNFGLLMHNYRAVLAPDEDIAGRPVNAVVLINKYTGQTVMRVWIDTQTKLVLKKERYASNGAVTYQTRFEQIRYTEAIPKEIFTVPNGGFTHTPGPTHAMPSSDLQSVVRTAGFQAKNPKYLPEGFVPVAGDVNDVKGIRTLHLLYSDGIRTVSLFENAGGAAVDLSRFNVHQAKVENNDAQYVEQGATTLLAWTQERLHCTLVGELGREELIRIAASV